MTYRERERITVSFLIALSIHLLLFLVLQLVVRFEESRIRDYTGPLFVQIENEVVPTIRSQPVEEQQEKVPEQSPPKSGEQPAAAEARPEIARQEERVDSFLPDGVVPEITAPVETVPSVPLPPDTPEEAVVPPSPPAVKTPPADEYSPLVPLDQLDRALAELQVDSNLSEPAAEISAVDSRPADGESAQQPLDPDQSGFTIEWEDPAAGREAVTMVEPSIPLWVSKQGLELKVVVAFVLTPQGILSAVRLEESSGYSDVDSSVLEAVRKWKFESVVSNRLVRGRLPYRIIPD